LSYGEFSELLRTARKLITGVRAIDAGDLNLPERSVNFSVDVVELGKRAADAELLLRRTPNDFKAPLATPDTANLDVMRGLGLRRGLSWRGASFGVGGAVRLSTAGNSPADRQMLLAQASSVQRELAQRVEQLTELAKGFNAGSATEEEKRDYALARLRIVFGKAFVVLPRFTAANAAELEKALADDALAQDGDPLASATWFERVARVRDGAARLNAALNYSEALNTGER